MDAATVGQEIILPKLKEVFGNSLANIIFAKGTMESIHGSTEQEKLKLMCEKICNDPKVVNMWGEAQANSQKLEWLKNIP